MEYLIGSLLTLVMLVIVNKYFKRQDVTFNSFVTYSQSHVHELLRPLMPDNVDMQKILVTQASKHFDKTYIRIIILNDKAYWIKDSILYMANFIDGMVDKESSVQVDIMAMDKVQLNKMMFIVDRLTEGTTNDYWNTGK